MRDIGLKFFGNGAREMHACPSEAVRSFGAFHENAFTDCRPDAVYPVLCITVSEKCLGWCKKFCNCLFVCL